MEFNLKLAIEILERTPKTVRCLLENLSPEWILENEGPDTWSPFDVVGHLIHGEKTDWISRARIILEQGGNKTFERFDRFAQFRESQGKTLSQLLDEFERLRSKNLETLLAFQLTENQLAMKGVHPSFGPVTLRQLLSTWVAHDLGHIAQITRVMAKQYKEEVGPWVEYLPVLSR